MLKSVCSALALGSAMIAFPAQAAEQIVLTENDGSYTGEFQKAITTAGSFTHEFEFDVDFDGLSSVTLSTNFTALNQDIDFTEILLNGSPLNITLIPGPGGSDQGEFASIFNYVTTSGTQYLTVKGTAGSNSAYTGEITFMPTGAIPEPATWLMMLLGFAAIGAFMRSNSTGSSATKRVRYNF